MYVILPAAVPMQKGRQKGIFLLLRFSINIKLWQHDGAGSSAERYDSLDRWLSRRLMSISNCADESDRTTANNSMFKQRPGRVYAHILNHNTVIWSDKAGKQPATPGRAAGINTALAKQITTLNAGERDSASGYVKRTWCEWREKLCKRRPYKAPFCLKGY